MEKETLMRMQKKLYSSAACQQVCNGLISFTCCCRQPLHADDDDSVPYQGSSITGWRSCHKCCVLQQSKQIGHQHWASETWVQFLLRIWNFTTSAQGGGKAYWKFPVVEGGSREGFQSLPSLGQPCGMHNDEVVRTEIQTLILLSLRQFCIKVYLETHP